MSVNFKNAIPSEMVIRQPVSSSKSILRKNLMEVQPHDSAVHSPGSNEIIRFNVSSNSDFLLGHESYFRFRLRRTLPLSTTLDNSASLDVGGVHALFKSIEVRSLSTGTLLQRYDNYNRYYSLKSMTQQSPEEVEYMGGQYGDSVHDRYMTDAHKSGEYLTPTGTIAGAVFTDNGNLLVGTADSGRALSEFSVGDLVRVQTVAAEAEYPYIGRVDSVTDDDNVVLDPAPTATIVAGNISHIRVEKRHERQPARQWALKTYGAASAGVDATNDKVLEFRPLVSFLDQSIPLFLMRGGIEIAFELENADRCIKSGLDIQADAGSQGYQITNPRYMAMMATPHPDIVDEYVQQWKSEAGLVYSIPSVKTRRIQGNSGNTNNNIQMHPGVRSARKVYTLVQDSDISEGSDALARSENSVSMGIRSLINKYQYKVGSHEYPNRPVDLQAAGQALYSTEALEQLRLVSESSKFRFSPEEWMGLNTLKIANDTKVSAESRFWCMCADLSRDNGAKSGLTGADLSVVPLDLEFERSAVYPATYTGNPVYYSFIEHDAYLKLSSAQLSVMN